jgi:hypothetical protein
MKVSTTQQMKCFKMAREMASGLLQFGGGGFELAIPQRLQSLFEANIEAFLRLLVGSQNVFLRCAEAWVRRRPKQFADNRWPC